MRVGILAEWRNRKQEHHMSDELTPEQLMAQALATLGQAKVVQILAATFDPMERRQKLRDALAAERRAEQ